jgi:hypothetical protein
MSPITIRKNPLLAIGPNFPNLAQVSSDVDIENNASLARVDGLSALDAADSIVIRDNAQLESVDLPALKSACELIITCNPQLPDASLAAMGATAGPKIIRWR